MSRLVPITTITLVVAASALLAIHFVMRSDEAGGPEKPKEGYKIDRTADEEKEWRSEAGGFRIVGSGGGCLYTTAKRGAGDYMDVRTWNGTAIVKVCEVFEKPFFGEACWWSPQYCVFLPIGSMEPGPLSHKVRFRKPGEPKADRDVLVGRGWYCKYLQPSRSGTFLGLGIVESSGHKPPDTPPDFDFDHPRLRVALMARDAVNFEVVGTLVGEHARGPGTVRTVMPSDDGAYVAIAGWSNGLAMIDAKQRKVIWNVMIPTETGLSYADFSTDTKVVYAGGIDGVVYAMDVATGKVLNKWAVPRVGKVPDRHEIECLAVSPDGRWVAVGTGPEGLVFVGSTATNRVVRVLKHREGTVFLVQFSPDSRALASWAPGAVKIWNVSRWDPTPASAPASAATAPTRGASPSSSPRL
jgi:hypothetical protein